MSDAFDTTLPYFLAFQPWYNPSFSFAHMNEIIWKQILIFQSLPYHKKIISHKIPIQELDLIKYIQRYSATKLITSLYFSHLSAFSLGNHLGGQFIQVGTWIWMLNKMNPSTNNFYKM